MRMLLGNIFLLILFLIASQTVWAETVRCKEFWREDEPGMYGTYYVDITDHLKFYRADDDKPQVYELQSFVTSNISIWADKSSGTIMIIEVGEYTAWSDKAKKSMPYDFIITMVREGSTRTWQLKKF